ncbi:MAG TPA: lipopolysaccharide assembly protein LapA domain-containing protein [Acidimicrobiales bacterium]|nr:lipopolysaccharide assembly protein LapA domain-containing protein [Acidimicrobiales bacterium]
MNDRPDRQVQSQVQPRSEPQPDRPVRDWAPLVAGLLLLLVVAVFVLQNGDKVAVEFLFFEGSPPLGVALLLAAVLGGLSTLFLGFVRRTRSRFRRR